MLASSMTSVCSGSESLACAFLLAAEVSWTDGLVTRAVLLLKERVDWLRVEPVAVAACFRRVVGILAVEAVYGERVMRGYLS